MTKLITMIMVGTIVLASTSCNKSSTNSSGIQIPSWVTDASVTTAFYVATKTGLQIGINDTAKRKAMANLLQYISTQVNSFVNATGNNDPQALADYLNANVPPDIKTQYPELISFAVPLIVGGYQSVWDKYGNNAAKLYPWLKDAAAGMSMGAGVYAGH